MSPPLAYLPELKQLISTVRERCEWEELNCEQCGKYLTGYYVYDDLGKQCYNCYHKEVVIPCKGHYFLLPKYRNHFHDYVKHRTRYYNRFNDFAIDDYKPYRLLPTQFIPVSPTYYDSSPQNSLDQ